MATQILVMGESGSGKTCSVKTLNPAETFIISIIDKDLSFPGSKKMYNKNNRIVVFENFDMASYKEDKEIFKKISNKIATAMKNIAAKKPEIKNIIIDDSQYLMAYEFMSRNIEKGYDKFNDIARNFLNILQAAKTLPDHLNIVFLHHVEVSDGLKKAKTIGKMLDSAVTVEGLFTYVLMSDVRIENGKRNYFFHTNTNGSNTCKTPEGLFSQDEIPNDLQLVINSINKYTAGE